MRLELDLADETRLDYADFVALTMDRSLAVREDNMKLAFEHFRRSKSQYLTEDDLVEVLDGDTHAREMMGILDSDGDGKVSFEDFKRAMVEIMEDDDDEHGLII